MKETIFQRCPAAFHHLLKLLKRGYLPCSHGFRFLFLTFQTFQTLKLKTSKQKTLKQCNFFKLEDFKTEGFKTKDFETKVFKPKHFIKNFILVVNNNLVFLQKCSRVQNCSNFQQKSRVISLNFSHIFATFSRKSMTFH